MNCWCNSTMPASQSVEIVQWRSALILSILSEAYLSD